ncbi:ribonuclease III [Holzapfeliella floricola]|nr:ribonuclease III [Holzapfeliella floricola]
MVSSKFTKKLRDDFQIIFKDMSLLDEAFTHSSYSNEHRNLELKNYEKLEFLGDAVLELAISEFLYHQFPDLDEGELTRFRSNVVRTEGFSKFAKEAEFDQEIMLGKGEENNGARLRKTLLEDVFEAFNGALFLDQGMPAVYQFLKVTVFPDIIKGDFSYNADYKTQLQELLQQNGSVKISYETLRETGSDNDKIFEVAVYAAGEKLAEGTGDSKKKAEQHAASEALKKLQ